jgi:hypothetical protein
MKTLLKLTVVFISLSANVFFATLIIYYWPSLRPTVVRIATPLLHPTTKEYQKSIEAIRQYIHSQEFASESDRIDFVRNWVYKNSIHKIDAQHREYAFNTPRVISKLWHTHLSKQDYAHLSCGPRAMAMKNILNSLGIRSRIISVFTDDYPQVYSHTFLEVLNAETKRWELQDPDFNIYYIDLETNKRIATSRLIWGDLDTVVPISKNKKGWKANNVEHLKQHFFEAMMYMNHLMGEKSVILINTGRFNAGKIFKKNGNVTFYEFVDRQHYGKPIFIENQGFGRK